MPNRKALKETLWSETANLCHACGLAPGSRGGNERGRGTPTRLVLGEDISRNEWNSLWSCHGFKSERLVSSGISTSYVTCKSKGKLYFRFVSHFI